MVAAGQEAPTQSPPLRISEPESRPGWRQRAALPAQPPWAGHPGAGLGRGRPGDQRLAQHASCKRSPAMASRGQTAPEPKFCRRPRAPAAPSPRAPVTCLRQPRAQLLGSAQLSFLWRPSLIWTQLLPANQGQGQRCLLSVSLAGTASVTEAGSPWKWGEEEKRPGHREAHLPVPVQPVCPWWGQRARGGGGGACPRGVGVRGQQEHRREGSGACSDSVYVGGCSGDTWDPTSSRRPAMTTLSKTVGCWPRPGLGPSIRGPPPGAVASTW